MNASHSWLVIFKCACESAIGLPVYFCGPPLAQHTISVTRYLNPGGGTRWCASSTRGFAFPFARDSRVSLSLPLQGSEVLTYGAVTESPSGEPSSSELNRQLTNPVSSLWSISNQFNNF